MGWWHGDYDTAAGSLARTGCREGEGTDEGDNRHTL